MDIFCYMSNIEYGYGKNIVEEKVCQRVAFWCGYLNIWTYVDILWIYLMFVNYWISSMPNCCIWVWIFEDMYMLWIYFDICQIFDMDIADLLRLKKYVKLLHLGVFSSVLTVSNSEVSFPKDIQGLQRQPQTINQTPI